MKFLDLRVEFRSVKENEWAVRITDPGALRLPREAEVSFELPFSPGHLEHWLDRIKDNVRRGHGYHLQVYRVGIRPSVRYLTEEELPIQLGNVRGQASGPSHLTKALGSDLFTALFGSEGGEAYKLYNRARRRANERRRGLRIRLILPKDGVLDSLPFEYFYDPHRGEYLARAAHPVISIVRAVPPAIAGRIDSVPPYPLRLWYVSASPNVNSQINDFHIISDANMYSGMRVIPVPILEADTNKLINHLDTFSQHSPHIIHVSAHGDSGLVFFERPGGQVHPVLVESLGTQLVRAEELHLIVFSVCNVPVSCARDLCCQGVKVVTMQMRITDGPEPERPAAARHFQQAFYESYFGSYDLDSAVVRGRQRVDVEINDTMEWGTPALMIPDVPLRRLDKLISFLVAGIRVSIARWVLIIFGMALIITAAFFVRRCSQPPPPPLTIQQMVIYASDKRFVSPQDGRRFPIDIKGESGSVPIEVLAAPPNRQLCFTAEVLDNDEATVLVRSQNGPRAQFEYIPVSAFGVDVLEFCVHEKRQEEKEYCKSIVLDITFSEEGSRAKGK